MSEEQILEMQEEMKKLLEDKTVLEDALNKTKIEVDRLKKTNQAYYEKLVDNSAQETSVKEQEQEINKDYISIDELTSKLMGKE